MPEEANIKDEKFVVKLTEWDLDTIHKALLACTYPGTHIDVVNNLIKKIKEVSNGNNHSNHDSK